MITLATILIACALTTMPAFAGDLKIANAWVRIPASHENPSAFLLVQNHDSKNRTMIGGRCDGCDWIEIRRVVFKDGIMTSEKMDEMMVPAGGAVAFVPRGLFVSLIGLGSLEPGAVVPIEIEFKNGEMLAFEATIRQP